MRSVIMHSSSSLWYCTEVRLQTYPRCTYILMASSPCWQRYKTPAKWRTVSFHNIQSTIASHSIKRRVSYVNSTSRFEYFHTRKMVSLCICFVIICPRMKERNERKRERTELGEFIKLYARFVQRSPPANRPTDRFESTSLAPSAQSG